MQKQSKFKYILPLDTDDYSDNLNQHSKLKHSNSTDYTSGENSFDINEVIQATSTGFNAEIECCDSQQLHAFAKIEDSIAEQELILYVLSREVRKKSGSTTPWRYGSSNRQKKNSNTSTECNSRFEVLVN